MVKPRQLRAHSALLPAQRLQMPSRGRAVCLDWGALPAPPSPPRAPRPRLAREAAASAAATHLSIHLRAAGEHHHLVDDVHAHHQGLARHGAEHVPHRLCGSTAPTRAARMHAGPARRRWGPGGRAWPGLNLPAGARRQALLVGGSPCLADTLSGWTVAGLGRGGAARLTLQESMLLHSTNERGDAAPKPGFARGRGREGPAALALLGPPCREDDCGQRQQDARDQRVHRASGPDRASR